MNTQSAIELPRRAIQPVGREGSAAVAFSIGGNIKTKTQRTTVELLLRLFEHTPPDLILFETASIESILIARKEALGFFASQRERIMKLSKAEAIKSVSDNGLLGVS